jgi:CTP:phosphocholine cytidylyltransferase-like protein
MGKLFKTPKHMLLYNGLPSIIATTSIMKEKGKVKCLVGDQYSEIPFVENQRVRKTNNSVETVLQTSLHVSTFIIDCDVIPLKLDEPTTNTVYLFKNTTGINQYSNFKLDSDGYVIDCNEKGEEFEWCGAGVYYFADQTSFYDSAYKSKSMAEIIKHQTDFANLHNRPYFRFKGNTTSKIFRFGTLQDILCS